MSVYEYKALNINGKHISGVIDAESVFSAKQKLRSSRIFPTHIKEAYDAQAKKEYRAIPWMSYFQRIKASEIAMITRQLSTLVSAGFPLVSALDTIIPQCGSYGLKRMLTQIKDSILEGKSFADSLSKNPKVFSQLYINMVHAGETSGTLDIVMERLAEIIEKQQSLKKRIQSALAYPILMSFIGAAVLFFLLAFIVPTITSLFAEKNQILPLPTQILITISNFLKNYWWVLLVVLVGIFLVFSNLKKTTRGKYLWDKFKLSLPIIGNLIQKITIARFSGTLGSLLENGVSMLTSLEIVKNIVGNVLVSETIETAAKSVEKGQALAESLSISETFPHLAIQMIKVGEQSGQLENMLKKISHIYESEVETSVVGLTTLLEPVMILLMGSAVGFIVLSILLPIFKLTQLVK